MNMNISFMWSRFKASQQQLLYFSISAFEKNLETGREKMELVVIWTTQTAEAATWKNTYPYLLETLFSEELLQRRDVVSLSFWKLYIPYRIGAFSRRYGKLSGIVV
jgi:hypothetical protein